MRTDNNQNVFFELLRAGLWEREAHLSQYENVDYDAIMQLAEEQTVIGLVTAGLEHVVDVKVPQDKLLQYIGYVLQMEQQNQAMNAFIGSIMERLNAEGIDAVLIKGQGVAQCYERPLWRSAGDVDLLLNDENYTKGKPFLSRISETKPEEYSFNKEFITNVGGWCIELHGSLRSALSTGFNNGVDDLQYNICDSCQIRYWENNGKKIPLPEENNDVLVVFTHYVKHFYKGGLGVRQICDWIRLIWKYRETIDGTLLEERLQKMGLLNEWRAFAAYAVEYLGIPFTVMPLYSGDAKWTRKAKKIQEFIISSGNFGHNSDVSYFVKYPFLIRKTVSMWHRVKAMLQHASIFPFQTVQYLPHVLYSGLWSAVRGE